MIMTSDRRLGYLRSGRAGRLITTPTGAEKYVKIVGDHSIVGEVMFLGIRSVTTVLRQ